MSDIESRVKKIIAEQLGVEESLFLHLENIHGAKRCSPSLIHRDRLDVQLTVYLG